MSILEFLTTAIFTHCSIDTVIKKDYRSSQAGAPPLSKNSSSLIHIFNLYVYTLYKKPFLNNLELPINRASIFPLNPNHFPVLLLLLQLI